MRPHETLLLLAVFAGCSFPPPNPREPQMLLERVGQMPNLPQPYVLRDWAKVAREGRNMLVDGVVVDFDAGE